MGINSLQSQFAILIWILKFKPCGIWIERRRVGSNQAKQNSEQIHFFLGEVLDAVRANQKSV